MNVEDLVPRPVFQETFRRNRERFIPDRPGSYVLSTFEKRILYIGLSINLRRRFGEHLDSSEKTALTANGIAFLFYWIEGNDIRRFERTWMNMHVSAEGVLPILNKVFSPVTT